MKKLYEAWQNNSGGYLIGPSNVYIIATSEDAAEMRLRAAQSEGILSTSYCTCCGPRWLGIRETDDVVLRGERENESCYLDEELNLIPLRLLNFEQDPIQGAKFSLSKEEVS